MEQTGPLIRISIVPSNITAVLPVIRLIRGRQVILASDLAQLFGVPTKRLNEQIRRNAERFPGDFAFQLTPEEAANLRSQFATSSSGHGGRRYRPFALTEHGVVMAANVLNSPRAVAMSLEVVREFIRLRTIAASHDSLKSKLGELERAVKARLERHESQIDELFGAVEALIDPASARKTKKQIGFLPESR